MAAPYSPPQKVTGKFTHRVFRFSPLGLPADANHQLMTQK